MAADPITWRNMRPISIADELMAYAKYSGGAGDALKGMGTTIDDLLQRKSTRDTEAFLARADALPTAEARNAALQQAREGFNLINVGHARKNLRATELHDFARTKRAEEAAQAADLLLTQKGTREDVIADNIRADRRLKHEELKAAVEQGYRGEEIADMHETQSRLADQFDITSQLDRDKFTQQKVRDTSVIKAADATTGLNQRKIDAIDLKLLQDKTYGEQMKAIKTAREAAAKSTDKSNTLVQDAYDLAFSANAAKGPTWDNKKLRQQYGNDLLRSDIPMPDGMLSQAGIISADEGITKTDYSPTARRNLVRELENHVVEQNPALRNLTNAKGERVSKAIAEKIIKSSTAPDGGSLEMHFGDAKDFFDKNVKARREENLTKSIENGLNQLQNKDGVEFTKGLAALKKRLNIKSRTLNEEQKGLLDQNRAKAVDGITIDLSKLKSRQKSGVWDTNNQPVNYDEKHKLAGTQKQAITNIINKQAGEISTTDLDDLAKHILDEVKKLGIDDPTDKEIADITKRTSEQYFDTYGDEDLATKLAKATLLRSERVRIAAAQMTQQADLELVPGQVEKELRTEVVERHKRAKKDGTGPGVVPDYLSWLTKLKQGDRIDSEQVQSAVERMDLALEAVESDAGVRSDIILHFLKNNSKIGTWGTTSELILDWDEDGVINDRFWTTASLDQEISDIPKTDEDNVKLLRIMMEKTGKDNFPMTEKKWNKMLHDSVILKNNNLIEAATYRLNEMTSYQQHVSRVTKRKMLEEQINTLAAENKKLNSKWTNKFAYTIKDK